ncbi:MAG: hypothetical protein ACE5GS_09645 [Kiloniellaceae bacterium]
MSVRLGMGGSMRGFVRLDHRHEALEQVVAVARAGWRKEKKKLTKRTRDPDIIARMTKLLKEVLDRAAKLPEAEQDALAAIILEEMEDERRWAEAFARSQEALEKLAKETREEYRQGKTTPLNFDKR